MKKLLIWAALLPCLLFPDIPLLAQSLRVASYNIRYDNPGDRDKGNGWDERCPVVCSQVLFHDFDIFGAQEVLKGQLDDMLAALPGYGYTGVGRSDGHQKGEYAPIFYKTDRFELLDSGHFWLSKTPDEPKLGWDARYERICTWGEFRDRESGKMFLFMNTHFDHVGVKARSESAKMIVTRMRKMADGNPVIVTGDFNVDQRSDSYGELVRGGHLCDCFDSALVRMAHNGTINSFTPGSRTDSRIDHVLVTPGVEVLRYGVLTDLYWRAEDDIRQLNATAFPSEPRLYDCPARTPSDHYPVLVEIIL